MAIQTPCQTHGAIYGIELKEDVISVTIELPGVLYLNEAGEEMLISNIHNAMELVLTAVWSNVT